MKLCTGTNNHPYINDSVGYQILLITDGGLTNQLSTLTTQ